MADSRREKAIRQAESMADFVNTFNTDNSDFISAMGSQHRTLQQNFTRLCMDWLKYLSNCSRYDLRNEASVKLAGEIIAKVPEETRYLPMV